MAAREMNVPGLICLLMHFLYYLRLNRWVGGLWSTVSCNR